MSGYASKAEVVEMLKHSIVTDYLGTGLSRDPKDYNLSGIVRDNFQPRGRGYGWSLSDAGCDSAAYTESFHRHLRKRKGK
jgi:hypothetical protein